MVFLNILNVDVLISITLPHFLDRRPPQHSKSGQGFYRRKIPVMHIAPQTGGLSAAERLIAAQQQNHPMAMQGMHGQQRKPSPPHGGGPRSHNTSHNRSGQFSPGRGSPQGGKRRKLVPAGGKGEGRQPHTRARSMGGHAGQHHGGHGGGQNGHGGKGHGKRGKSGPRSFLPPIA